MSQYTSLSGAQDKTSQICVQILLQPLGNFLPSEGDKPWMTNLQQLHLGVTTRDHLPPSHPVPRILLHESTSMNLSIFIKPSQLRLSLVSLASSNSTKAQCFTKYARKLLPLKLQTTNFFNLGAKTHCRAQPG